MRTVRIKAKKGGRSFLYRDEFYEREIEDGLQGRTPGEWVLVTEGKSEGPLLLAMANPLIQQGPCLRALKSFQNAKEALDFAPERYIQSSIDHALEKRARFKYLDEGSRLIYGAIDGLPGVICDEYSNCALLQINTAGMDIYRDVIRNHLQTRLGEKKIIFLDQEEYRKVEGLPQHSREEVPDIEVSESGIKYLVKKEVMQKIGHYYDHRINRLKLREWIGNYKGKLNTGVDLFCYSGSWGLNALAAGDKLHMDFVDQGNFNETIETNLSLNNFQGRGQFHRADVFDWLKKKAEGKEKYDLVISDPPAFSKSLKNKSKALGGYAKLHKAIAKLCRPGTLLAIGSCTHGVTLDELDQTINQGFWDTGMKVNLLDIGIQGPDHLMASLGDRENYIKYLLYCVD